MKKFIFAVLAAFTATASFANGSVFGPTLDDVKFTTKHFPEGCRGQRTQKKCGFAGCPHGNLHSAIPAAQLLRPRGHTAWI